MQPLKPFFYYFGSKWRLSAKYPKPKYDTIIEPFAGSAGYSCRYYDRKIILIEKNPIIVSIWDYLINVKTEEILSLPDIEPGQLISDLNICQEAKWLMGYWMGSVERNPANQPQALMIYSTKKRKWRWGKEIKTRLAEQVPKIRHWKVICADYSSAPPLQATWIIDPPYQGLKSCYPFNDIDFKKLAKFCKTRNGQVIVAENVGADWLPFKSVGYDAPSVNNVFTGKKKPRKEAIWIK